MELPVVIQVVVHVEDQAAQVVQEEQQVAVQVRFRHQEDHAVL